MVRGSHVPSSDSGREILDKIYKVLSSLLLFLSQLAMLASAIICDRFVHVATPGMLHVYA